ncbi:MAG: flagellar hook-associated protein FlgK [Desulfobacca sp.]|nr:flagellar hook-associated protein FlgK [Desulfobacca sp.]
MSINTLLEIGGRALQAEQVGVEVTSHNIANINTTGYCRQHVDLVTTPSIQYPWGNQGYGVAIDSIQRYFDPYLAQKIDDKTAAQQDYNTQKTELASIAGLFNETTDVGLHNLLTSFWQSWHDLADNPTGAAQRQVVVQQAEALAAAFSSLADDLVQQRQALLVKISPTITEINTITKSIAKLNQEIVSVEASGQAANDLRDQRQVKLNNLAGLVGINYFELDNGSINVMLDDGTILVQSAEAWDLSYEVSGGEVVIKWQGAGGVEKDVTDDLSGGQLSALLYVRDDRIPAYLDSLNELAQELIGEVNRQHSQGVGLSLYSQVSGTYGVDDPDTPLKDNAALPFGDQINEGETFNIYVDDGNGTNVAVVTITITAGMTLNGLRDAINAALPAHLTASVVDNKLSLQATGSYSFGFGNDNSNVLMALGLNTFFTSTSGDTQNFAFSLGINDIISADASFIATGQFDRQGQHAVGDNSNALALADLETANVGPGDLTFAEAYQELVSTIGLDTQKAEQQETLLRGILDQYTDLRDALSGVSLDEELTALIKFQRAYQAAAKLISVADELYETLLSLK